MHVKRACTATCAIVSQLVSPSVLLVLCNWSLTHQQRVARSNFERNHWPCRTAVFVKDKDAQVVAREVGVTVLPLLGAYSPPTDTKAFPLPEHPFHQMTGGDYG